MVEVREQAVEGGEVELSCLVPRSRPVAALRWYRDRKELKGITRSRVGGVGAEPRGAGLERRRGSRRRGLGNAGLYAGAAWRGAHRFWQTPATQYAAIELIYR